jgi:hypothetical protein
MLLLFAVPLAAQQPRRAAPPASVRGVVYDSLLRAPLEGAHVYIMGTASSATTDAGGRFRLDSVAPGSVAIAFEHPDLDSAGLTSNVRRIEIAAGRPATVELDVPSLATMYRAACGAGGVTHAARDSGVVFGMVQDVGTHARLAGARVKVSWVAARLGAAHVEVSRPGVEVATDSVGNFYVCGVPREYVITVIATAGPFVSGATELLLGARGIARRDLGVSRDSANLAADTSGTRRGRATVVGTVLDENDRPRPNARITVDDAAANAYANEDGRFILAGLPAGSQTVMVRMVGYSATRVPVMLRNDDTVRLTVRVRGLTVLDTIRVTGAPSRIAQIQLDELEHRLRTGSAFILRGEEVKRRPSMRAVFQGLPSLLIEGRSVFNFTMRSFTAGKYWPVSLFVDGLPATTESVQSYRPDQIIAVEWYPRGAQAPARYQSMSHPDAGVMLIWTRFIR